MFSGMLNDRVTLVKKDGTVARENISAMVQPKTIFMKDATLPIAPGDRLLRTIPSGLVEEYVVIDPGFHSRMGGIDAHFQTKVKRSDAPVSDIKTIVNNIQGENAKVNIGSIDNSSNFAFSYRNEEIFNSLRSAIDDSRIVEADKIVINEAIDGMQNSSSKDEFRNKYVEFMSIAANHVAVFGPLMGALAHLLK